MTIKELAEFSGKTERTVQRWVKVAGGMNGTINDKMSSSSPSFPADYTVDEVELILNQSRLGVNAVCILMANAREQKPPQISSIDKSIEVMMLFMERQQKQQQEFFEKVLTKITAPQENKPLQIASTKTTRSLLNQNVYNYAKDKLDGDIREAWNNVYEELYFIAHVKIRVRSKNSGKSKLDCIEEAGLLECANNITLELIGE